MAIKNLGRVVGLSAYEVWLKQGNSGTEADFLASLECGLVTPERTTFISTDNLIYYNKPNNDDYALTGSGTGILTKYVKRCVAIIDVKSNTDYSLFFTPFTEDNLNYFKMASFTKTKEELIEYIKTNNQFDHDGSLLYEMTNPVNFITGENDKCLVIQFSNATAIEYAELLEGTYSKPKYNSYDECLSILGFGAYNKKEVKDLINSNKYSLNNNTLIIKTKKALYTFKKVTDTSINVDTWRLYKGDLLDSDGNVVGNMWLNSDAEGAIRMTGENDFVSGYHGDEIMTDLKIIVDGNVVDNSGDIEETSFNNITIVCKSDVYHCNTSSSAGTKAFERIKKLVFEGNKVTVSNDYVVKDTNGLSIARVATLLFQCFKKDNNSNLMLNYVNSSDDIELYPITTSSCDTPSLETENSEVYYYTKYGVIRQKMLKGLNVGTFNPFVEDYTSQGALRLKTYWCYDNLNVVLNDRLLSEFEWEIE